MTANRFFNVGAPDRAIRAALGFAVIALALAGPKTPWGWLGLLPLATAAIGWCPLYSVLGVTTRAKAVAK